MKKPNTAFADLPDAATICHDALLAGGLDPLSLRFRVVEYERASGELIRVLSENSGLLEALENTGPFIAGSSGSDFRFEPVGFLQ